MRSLKIEEKNVHHIGEYVAIGRRPNAFSVTGRERRFMLTRIGPDKWRANGRSSTNACKSRFPRLTFSAPTLETAISQAEEKLFGDTRDPQIEEIEISEVFSKWKKTKKVQAETMKVYLDGIDRFLEWTDMEELESWGELTRGTLQQYLGTLSGYRPNYKKNLWKPIRAASLWASLEWPGIFSDIAGRIQISNDGLQYPDEKVALSLAEAAEFCFFLREFPDGWKILPGVVLQSLCGLRLTEAFRLRWDWIDVHGRTATIQGRVNNQESARRIPLPLFVTSVLLEAPRCGERVLSEYSAHGNYAKAVSRALRRWSPGIRLEPKGLRRTLESAAVEQGWEGYAFNRYLGRSPASIAERHYIAVGAKLSELLKEQVTDKIDRVLAPFREKWRVETPKVIQLRVS